MSNSSLGLALLNKADFYACDAGNKSIVKSDPTDIRARGTPQGKALLKILR
jgi:hypothetical protein